MAGILGNDPRCSIARSLEVLGERWTFLVVREAFRGRTRFSEFRDALGIARDVLADRLSTLVECGVLERRSYRDEGSRERDEYVLAPAGRDLAPVLAALTAWGDVHRPTEQGPVSGFAEEATGQVVTLEFRTGDGRAVASADVRSVLTPAAFA